MNWGGDGTDIVCNRCIMKIFIRLLKIFEGRVAKTFSLKGQVEDDTSLIRKCSKINYMIVFRHKNVHHF